MVRGMHKGDDMKGNYRETLRQLLLALAGVIVGGALVLGAPSGSASAAPGDPGDNDPKPANCFRVPNCEIPGFFSPTRRFGGGYLNGTAGGGFARGQAGGGYLTGDAGGGYATGKAGGAFLRGMAGGGYLRGMAGGAWTHIR
jgi:hypothetical protein